MTLFAKSIFSLVMFFQGIVALFSILELAGRSERRFSPTRIRAIHKINGYIFLSLFLALSYYCYPFLKNSAGPITPRALYHSLFAIGTIFMLSLKILIVRVYKKLSPKAVNLGLTVFMLTVGMVATSGGYYLAVSAQRENRKTAQEAKNTASPANRPAAVEREKAERGRQLFERSCRACHETDSEANKVGPGLKGIMKKEKFPVSKWEANEANLRRQLTEPFGFMPPQTQLTDKEIEEIIEYLKTL